MLSVILDLWTKCIFYVKWFKMVQFNPLCSEIQMAQVEKEKETVVKQHLLLDFAAKQEWSIRLIYLWTSKHSSEIEEMLLRRGKIQIYHEAEGRKEEIFRGSFRYADSALRVQKCSFTHSCSTFILKQHWKSHVCLSHSSFYLSRLVSVCLWWKLIPNY